MMTIRLLLVEDHDIVRQGLRALFELEPDFEVVGEASNGLAVEGLVERLKPDVMLLDLRLPGLSGLEVAHRLREKAVKTCIVVLTMHSEIGYAFEAFQAGVLGYVLKGSGIQEVLKAIRIAFSGVRYLSPPLTETALHTYAAQMRDTPQHALESLTARERQVLVLVAQGLTNADIADRLVIGQRTVETHRANMMRKLNLHTQVDLILFALKRGLLQL